MSDADAEPKRGNYVSEWLGHRVYPVVAETRQTLEDQKQKRCPFLSEATTEDKLCVKPASSLGICTISSTSAGKRQDWLVCPYRALDKALLDDVARRLFRVSRKKSVVVLPAPTLALESVRASFLKRLSEGAVGVVYLQDKLGGEISITPTDRSPELAFDVTMVRVAIRKGAVGLGQYGILEVQTMDFHGSYRAVVKNLEDALRLHGRDFHRELRKSPQWLSQKIEGPNIANVFKRTFYQIMLKFQIGADESCAGCVLALPVSVWDSWQRHLGKPDLKANKDGTYSLDWKGGPKKPVPAWIYLFDLDISATTSPNPLVLRRVIATDANSMAHFALKIAPEAAVAGAGSADRVLATVRRRVAAWWPELGRGPVKI
ncbi:MAG: hypothetical protein WD690_11995 [Vicinamibacterales bacterium]